jgi:quinol-cytochrome oxidoreductase complex cytochrome b subunit
MVDSEASPPVPRAALNIPRGSVLALILAGLGAVLVLIGVFLPMADTESSLHIANNSLIQHWEGALVIGIALAGFLATFRPALRPMTFLCGAVVVGLAALAGSELPVEFRNELSRAVAGDASAGAGIYAVGVGGVLLALSAAFNGDAEES